MFDFIVFIFITARKTAVFLSPVTLEPLSYQLGVLCKKAFYVQDSWHHKAPMFATDIAVQERKNTF